MKHQLPKYFHGPNNFTKTRFDSLEKSVLNEPKLTFNNVNSKYVGPQIDFINKLGKIHSKKPIVTNLQFLGLIFFSVLFHLCVLVFIFYDFPFHTEKDDFQTVEVSFGLDSDVVKKNVSFEEKEHNNEVSTPEGTKSPETLPQLPKVFSQEEELIKNTHNQISDKVLLKKEKELKKIEVKDDKKISSSTKLSKEEILKRAKKDLLKVGDKNKDGDPFSKIPDSKLNINNTKAQKNSPVGSIDGKLISSLEAQYSALVQSHIKDQWNLAPGEEFDESLTLSVKIQLNSVGYVVGKPTVIQSSGNKRFDEIAINAIITAQPYPPIPEPIKHNIKFIYLNKIQPPMKSHR